MVQATKFLVDPSWKLVFHDLQINAYEVFKNAQLPVHLFEKKNARLSAEEYFRLWRELEALVDHPYFPLHIAQTVSTEAFNPPIFAVLCSPSFSVAIARLSQYKQLIGPMLIEVALIDQRVVVNFRCFYSNLPLPDSLVMAEIVFLVRLVRLATRKHIIPLQLIVKSRSICCKKYREYFGVEPSLGITNQVTFSKEDTDLSFLTKNEQMWQCFEPQLRKRLIDIDTQTTFVCHVRNSLLELLPSGLCSVEDVAQKLSVSKRTLQRRLSNENTCFQKELNQTREQLAQHYLSRTVFTNAQISFLLGFEDPNSFIRVFRSWTGITPEKFRREHRN